MGGVAVVGLFNDPAFDQAFGNTGFPGVNSVKTLL